MDKRALYKVVAEAIRIEYEEKSDTVYLVFEITDNDFKNKIKKDWTIDIDLELENKKLILKEE
jgi:hypothetical protein